MGEEKVIDACKRASLGARIIAGLHAGEFTVAFQPVVHVQTRALSGVECLLRWRHPQYGLLLPGAFESALHDPAVAHEATRFVLDVAFQRLRDRLRAGGAPPLVAIKVQPCQLLDDSLVRTIDELTRRDGVLASRTELELVENEETLAVVATREFTAPLRSLGVQLALDDFGTGYSSLATLAGARVDAVKLAREFFRLGPQHADSRAACVIRGVIDIVERLGMRAVVQGVENAAQMAWLATLPTVYAQGHYVGKAMYEYPATHEPR
ncbi:EAL domain-containing protein [Paraburkholderia sp. UYCP14C]|uniref:EAL domain-containing protein n=1 Tax=Paraburkholderia sp. UYCP14C TaxID=2511130 RepID=UPI00145A025A|nr:EAL domain-containing protein [Paraburkholderia sp. UYCP14C]